MSSYTTSENFFENVRPLVSSAALIAQNQVRVVFSEAVKIADVTKTDIDVFVGTTQETEVGAFAVAPVGVGTHETTFIITLDNALTAAEYAQALTVLVVNDLA
jgi:hypothetical protein